MSWTKVKITKNTDNTNIVGVTATWTDPNDSTKTFTYSDDRVDTSKNAEKTQFITEAKAALLAWQEKDIPTTAETTLLTNLNA